MRKLIALLALVILAPLSSFAAPIENNPFGVLTFLPWNDQWNNYMYKNRSDIDKAIKLIKKLGVSIIRVDFAWNDIEKEKGIYNFEKHDYIVSACQKNNIEILALIGYCPDWTGMTWNNPPPNHELFLEYTRALLNRYKDSIKYWEIWNEPNSLFYWSPQDDMKTYTELLKKTYSVIKDASPKSYVVLGGLTSEGPFALKSILRQGGGDYFDIVNFHPFVDPFRENGLNEIGYKLKDMRKELEKYGFKKKIWLTEIGVPGCAKKSCSWWFGKGTDEKQQAEFLKKVYDFLLTQKDVEKIFWAFFQDTTDHFKSGVDYFGLIRADFSKKPSYFTYQKIIKRWNKEHKFIK